MLIFLFDAVVDVAVDFCLLTFLVDVVVVAVVAVIAAVVAAVVIDLRPVLIAIATIATVATATATAATATTTTTRTTRTTTPFIGHCLAANSFVEAPIGVAVDVAVDMAAVDVEVLIGGVTVPAAVAVFAAVATASCSQ